MPGTNAGTGQPISFQCSACRAKKSHLNNYHYPHGYRNDVTLTGRVKKLNDGRSRGRSSNCLREYKCKHCGHKGWSRHSDLGKNEK